MSVYRCFDCEQYIDADYDGCNECPHDSREIICDGCLEDYPHPDYEFDFVQEE